MKHAAKFLIALLILGSTISIAKNLKTQQLINQQVTMENKVEIEAGQKYRYISANGIPNHEHGQFPNQHNPNTIQEQHYLYRVPLHPKIANQITKFTLQPFGIALNGIPFDPGAAEFWNHDFNSGWQYEALSGKINLGFDANHAHVQPNGAYHYHGLPTGLIQKMGTGSTMVLVGYAADGFPIYSQNGYSDPNNSKSPLKQIHSSYRLKQGIRPNGPGGTFDGIFVQDWEYVPGAGDLDECNGRFGVTPEYPQGIYHYYITQEFPFISRCFRGTPDESFRRFGPPGPLPPGRPGGPPPRRPGEPFFGPEGPPPGPGGPPPGPEGPPPRPEGPPPRHFESDHK